MNRNPINFFLGSAILLPVLCMGAEQAKPLPTLSSPVVSRMPDRSAWKIEYFGSVPAQSEDGCPDPDASGVKPDLAVSVKKDGNTYHVQYDRLMGGYRDVWVVNGIALAPTSTGEVAAIVPSIFFPATDFSASDFEEFEWITKENLKGTAEWRGAEVLQFEAASTNRTLSAREKFEMAAMMRQQEMIEADPDASISKQRIRSRERLQETMRWGDTFNAYLSVDSQRPLTQWTGDTLIRVTVQPTASSPLVLPSIVRERLELEQEKRERLRIKSQRRSG